MPGIFKLPNMQLPANLLGLGPLGRPWPIPPISGFHYQKWCEISCKSKRLCLNAAKKCGGNCESRSACCAQCKEYSKGKWNYDKELKNCNAIAKCDRSPRFYWWFDLFCFSKYKKNMPVEIRDGKNPGFLAKTLPTRVLLVKYGFNGQNG